MMSPNDDREVLPFSLLWFNAKLTSFEQGKRPRFNINDAQETAAFMEEVSSIIVTAVLVFG